jgi:hypothetical protein
VSEREKKRATQKGQSSRIFDLDNHPKKCVQAVPLFYKVMLCCYPHSCLLPLYKTKAVVLYSLGIRPVPGWYLIDRIGTIFYLRGREWSILPVSRVPIVRHSISKNLSFTRADVFQSGRSEKMHLSPS